MLDFYFFAFRRGMFYKQGRQEIIPSVQNNCINWMQKIHFQSSSNYICFTPPPPPPPRSCFKVYILEDPRNGRSEYISQCHQPTVLFLLSHLAAKETCLLRLWAAPVSTLYPLSIAVWCWAGLGWAEVPLCPVFFSTDGSDAPVVA